MLSWDSSRGRRIARHLLVWCLLAALPIYGFSATVVPLLGPSHSHRPSASTADPLDGWVDIRRGMTLTAAASARPHVHSHSLFERHHHGPGDETVVPLDGDKQRMDGDAGSSTGSVTQAIALASALIVAAPPQVRVASYAAAAPCVLHRGGDRLERPPKAC